MNIKAKLLALTAALALSSVAAAGDFLLTVTPGLSAQQYSEQSIQYTAQARAEYGNIVFADLPLWNRAIANAEAAARLEPNNPTYVQNAAMLYAQAGWWLPAFERFNALRQQVSLNDAALDMGAKVARNLGYMAMQRGDNAEARLYYTESLSYRDDAQVRQMLARLENTL
jgi:Tfp pilus assembly protein PilF